MVGKAQIKKISQELLSTNSISAFPQSFDPQLATLTDQPPEEDTWLHEIKFDGYRLLIYKKNNSVNIFTRNKNNWTHLFPSIVREVKKLPVENLILDGEVVVFDAAHKTNFQLLQNAIKENTTEFYYCIFDILYFQKFNLTEMPLLQRKNILQTVLSTTPSKILMYSDHVIGDGKKIFNKACRLGLEGIVSKLRDSTYNERRDKTWLKTKCIKRQEFVLGGYLPSARRKYFRSLLLGTYNKQQQLIYHGKVGTGFTQASLKEIHTLLTQYISSKMPYLKKPPGSNSVIWLKPELVAEVEFTEWTQDGTLRHPSFCGMRMDKKAKQIIREKPTIKK